MVKIISFREKNRIFHCATNKFSFTKKFVYYKKSVQQHRCFIDILL